MARRRTAGLVVAAALAITGCGGGSGSGDVVEVPLADLVEDHEAFDGETVATTGVVRTYDEPRHYWIEDEVPNRVELVPEDAVAPHLGDQVRITGRFTFRGDEGRRITVDDLEVLTEGDVEPA